MNIKHSILMTAAIFALSSHVMAIDISDGKKPRISDIQTTVVGDAIKLTINGINFLGRNNANPFLAIGKGLFKAPDFTATFSNNQIVITGLKDKLPTGDYLIRVSKDDNFSSEKSDFYDLTVGAVGPQGAKGETGEKGDKGDTGLQGIPGIQGDKGDTGAQGEPGPQGTKGDPGPQGIPGIAGISGYEVVSVNGIIANGFRREFLNASCPANKRVLGGGCSVNALNSFTEVISSQPLRREFGWSCIFQTSGINEQIVATAICANVIK